MSSFSGATVPIFSYAQAAKGLASAASTQSTSRNESPAASDKSVKDRSFADSTNVSATHKSPQPQSQVDDKPFGGSVPSKPVTHQADAAPAPTVHNEDNESAMQNNKASTSSHGGSSPSSHVGTPSLVAVQDPLKDDAAQQQLDGQEVSSDDTTVLASHGSSIQNESEKKSNEVEDDWEKVSVPSMAVETQYKAAPIPAVNVWQMRKEAQAAKLKDLSEQGRAIVPGTPNYSQKPRSGSEDFKRKSTSMGSVERETKTTDNTRTGHRKDMPGARPSRPASQHGDKTDTVAPPPVNDTQSWPTPVNSNFDERRQSASYDKPDAKPGSQKSHGNKWVAVPFVPTAKFETQLPPAAARRGGRGGARGRDTGNRGGGHAATSVEKQDAATSMGPPPLPRQSGEHDRGRRSEDQRGARGASVPTTTRPTSGDDSNSTFRKFSANQPKDQSTFEQAAFVQPAAQPPVEEKAPRTGHSSRSSSRHTGNVGGRMLNGERNTAAEQAPGGLAQSDEPVAKYSYIHDRNKGPVTGTSRGNGEFGRDRGSGRLRDWTRDKPESAREKVESWKDRESSGDQGTRREGRSERGRGTYRGRSNHSYNPPLSSSHAYTSPLPQNGFELPSRSNSHTESRSRQASQPFVPTQATNTPRTNPRSQSIPVGMMFPGYYNGMPNMPQGLPNIQTDMSMYGYSSQMPMQPSIMSAMPYNDPLNSYALLSMVMTQM